MIGVLIGLMTTLAVTQVLVISEGAKRTTTSGSDAQINGALALSALQRSMQPAGYGFGANPTSVGCTLTAQFNGAAVPGFATRLVPVTITSGASGAPDSIRILASGKDSYSLPLRVVSPGYNPTIAANKDNFTVAATRGVEGPRTDAGGTVIAPGDLMLAVIGADQACELFQATATPSGTTPKVDRADNAAKWNAVGFPTLIYDEGKYLVNMGSIIDRTFSIGNTSLQVTSLKVAADATPSYEGPLEMLPNIVNLKAMYGKDTNGDSLVDTWDNTTPTTNAGWLQVVAVRIAVVARSVQYEKEEVTTSNPLWDVGAALTVAGTATCGTSKCLSLKVDNLTDWKHYRYKIFDTVIPLRNMLWNS
ncbi:PilW family protein [Polaromonas sp. YR568]|uniref:PilW family protein n=1 Tax=Polaromonas sp. YR568 TaxID=1855301 RepID=UPI00398BEDB9